MPRADPVFYNFRNLYPHKKASHLASDGDKTNRDLLFYMLGQSGQLANQKMGEKLGLTYLAVIHRVGVFENLL